MLHSYGRHKMMRTQWCSNKQNLCKTCCEYLDGSGFHSLKSTCTTLIMGVQIRHLQFTHTHFQKNICFTYKRQTHESICSKDTHAHSLWLPRSVQVTCLCFPPQTCVSVPSCKSAWGAPAAACGTAPSAYRRSWCNTWAAWRGTRMFCGCRTDWRAGSSAGHEH